MIFFDFNIKFFFFKGKIVLPPLGATPDLLQRLLTGNREASKNYKENIIHYNASLAFASRQADYDLLPDRRGPYFMRIHGQVHHHIGGLRPTQGQRRQYAQLYILDAQQALEQRMRLVHAEAVNERKL